MDLLFHHIPKTAGTAVQKLVAQNYPPTQVVAMYEIERRPGRPGWAEQILSHAPKSGPAVYMGHNAIRLLPELATPFQYFTVLREPVDRVLSLYYYALNHKEPRPKVAELVQGESMSLRDVFEVPLAEVVEGGKYRPLRQFYNGQARNLLRGSVQGIPVDASAEEQDQLYEVAHKLLTEHFWVGAQERLDDFMEWIGSQLEWKTRRLEKVNVTSSRKKSTEIDSDLRELIEERNRLDVRLYGDFAFSVIPKE